MAHEARRSCTYEYLTLDLFRPELRSGPESCQVAYHKCWTFQYTGGVCDSSPNGPQLADRLDETPLILNRQVWLEPIARLPSMMWRGDAIHP